MPVASPFDRRVIWVGGIVFAVLMALSPRYGFDRDELYFLDGARHLQASYVDQPVLGPAVGVGVTQAVRRVAARAAGVARARGVGHGGGRRADRPRVRRRQAGAAAGGDRHRDDAGAAGVCSCGQHDRLRAAGVGGPGAGRGQDRADRRLPLVAGRGPGRGPRRGRRPQHELLRHRTGHRRAAQRRPTG